MKLLYSRATKELQKWFWILLVLNLVFIIGSKYYLKPLEPREMIRFETAKKVDVAGQMISHWKGAGKFHKAVQSIYIDYFFIVLYTFGLAIACIYLSRLTKHDILIRAAKLFSILLFIAGICDFIENISMIRSLYGKLSGINVMLTCDMAAAKFSIVIVSLLFIVVCMIFWAVGRFFGPYETKESIT
jgi:hypothetical protein